MAWGGDRGCEGVGVWVGLGVQAGAPFRGKVGVVAAAPSRKDSGQGDRMVVKTCPVD